MYTTHVYTTSYIHHTYIQDRDRRDKGALVSPRVAWDARLCVTPVIISI